MGKPNIFTGARALIYCGESTAAIGLFANCSWSIRQDKAPAYILGRFNPAEITSTSQEPVQMSLTGYRVLGSGPYTVGAKHLKDLLSADEDFRVQVVDRRTGKTVFIAQGCRVAGWSSGVAARGVSDVRIDVIGLIGHDESLEEDDTENNVASLPAESQA